MENYSSCVVLKNDGGIRPAGPQDRCFCCGSKIGEYHKSECTTLNRKVRVRYSFDIEIEVPHRWNKEDIENHRNHSRWCADNAIIEIDSFVGDDICLCEFFNCEVLEIPEAEPYYRDKNGDIHYSVQKG